MSVSSHWIQRRHAWAIELTSGERKGLLAGSQIRWAPDSCTGLTTALFRTKVEAEEYRLYWDIPGIVRKVRVKFEAL